MTPQIRSRRISLRRPPSITRTPSIAIVVFTILCLAVSFFTGVASSSLLLASSSDNHDVVDHEKNNGAAMRELQKQITLIDRRDDEDEDDDGDDDDNDRLRQLRRKSKIKNNENNELQDHDENENEVSLEQRLKTEPKSSNNKKKQTAKTTKKKNKKNKKKKNKNKNVDMSNSNKKKDGDKEKDTQRSKKEGAVVSRSKSSKTLSSGSKSDKSSKGGKRGKKEKIIATNKPTVKPTSKPTSSKPTLAMQQIQQPNLKMNMYGLMELLGESDIIIFEEQTALYMQDYYNSHNGGNNGENNGVNEGSGNEELGVFDVIANVKVTHQSYDGDSSQLRESGGSGSDGSDGGSSSEKIGNIGVGSIGGIAGGGGSGKLTMTRPRSILQNNHPLAVQYTTELFYRTTNPDLDTQSLMSQPFATEESRELFINDYLKSHDGSSFQGLTGISGVEFPEPTISPTISPTFAPTIDLESDEDVIVNATFHLALVQDFLLNVSADDEEEIREATLKFLFDNIGGEAKFQPQYLTINEIATESQVVMGSGGIESFIETIVFRMNVMFAVKASFVQWIEEGQEGDDDVFQDDGSKGDRQLYEYEWWEGSRGLGKAKCSTSDYCKCCLNGAINKNADSKACKAAGCNRRRCKKKRPQNKRLLFEHNMASRLLEINDNLYGLNFLDVIRQYTTNFKPDSTKSILNATNTTSVATCSSSRYADQTNSSSFACDVYEKNDCSANEDIDFEPDDEFCSSSQPSTSPTEYPSSPPSISSMPTVSPQPTDLPTMLPNFSPTKAPMSGSFFPTYSPTMAPVSACISSTFSDNFESGNFPMSPWVTSGDGAWAIDESRAFEGSFSIKSPNLEGSESSVHSNATLTLCPDFPGGVMSFQVLAATLEPFDIFFYYVDGLFRGGVKSDEFMDVAFYVPPGEHIIDFTYYYNRLGMNPLPPSPPERLGAVWIDEVAITLIPILSLSPSPTYLSTGSFSPTTVAGSSFPTVGPSSFSIPSRTPTNCDLPKVTRQSRFDGIADDNFGWSVSVWDSTAFVGNWRGNASVFSFQQGEWISSQNISSLDGGDSSVAVAGNFAVVGAAYKDEEFLEQGGVSVYERDSSDAPFVLVQTLFSPNPSEYGHYGHSVSVNENGDIAIGTPGEREGKGSVYVYQKESSNSIWILVETLEPDIMLNGNFGLSLVMSNGTLIVGANDDVEDDVFVLKRGSVFLFEKLSDETWELREKIVPPEDEIYGFGRSLDMDGSTIVTGGQSGATASSLVWMFDTSYSPSLHYDKITSPSKDEEFGTSVSLSNGLLAIGAPGSYYGNPGSVYIYRYDGAVFQYSEQLQPDNQDVAGGGNNFGYPVVLSKDHLVVGFPDNDINGVQSGSVFFYSIEGDRCGTTNTPTPER